MTMAFENSKVADRKMEWADGDMPSLPVLINLKKISANTRLVAETDVALQTLSETVQKDTMKEKVAKEKAEAEAKAAEAKKAKKS